MKNKKLALLGVGGIAVMAVAAYATLVTSETFRTTAVFVGVEQAPNSPQPAINQVTFAGWKLVNMVMGRSPSDTNSPNQVLAMTFACDLSSANLVVYDKSVSNNVATIASSMSVDQVDGVGITVRGKTNEVKRFVAQLQINPNGNSTDGVLSGFFTIAGRVHINPATGCPEAVLLKLDKDKLDQRFTDSDIANKYDPDIETNAVEAGLGHLIGVVDTIADGQTNTVLIPYGAFTVRGSRTVATP